MLGAKAGVSLTSLQKEGTLLYSDLAVEIRSAVEISSDCCQFYQSDTQNGLSYEELNFSTVSLVP